MALVDTGSLSQRLAYCHALDLPCALYILDAKNSGSPDMSYMVSCVVATIKSRNKTNNKKIIINVKSPKRLEEKRRR